MAHSPYRVEIAPAPKKQIAKLGSSDRKRVIASLVSLRDNPRPVGAKSLKGLTSVYRLRCGDHRVIYAIDENAGIVLVVRVRHRKDAYRNLDALDPAQLAAAIERAGRDT